MYETVSLFFEAPKGDNTKQLLTITCLRDMHPCTTDFMHAGDHQLWSCIAGTIHFNFKFRYRSFKVYLNALAASPFKTITRTVHAPVYSTNTMKRDLCQLGVKLGWHFTYVECCNSLVHNYSPLLEVQVNFNLTGHVLVQLWFSESVVPLIATNLFLWLNLPSNTLQ